MESHNHPSFIEPFQGAATGVGGILRDIFTMGARPIALLNSLRFGELDLPLNRHLVKGVVSGISWYGNCIGVPTVGGEITFNDIYSKNPLVNVFCLGIVHKDQLLKGVAEGEGNPVLYIGVIAKGFALQRIALEEMAKGLIKRLAVFKKIAQGKMAIDGIAFRQIRLANELFHSRYQRLFGFYHRDVVIHRFRFEFVNNMLS